MSATLSHIPVLSASEVQADPGALQRAWKSEDTFAIVPSHTNLRAAQIEAALDQLPERLRTGHLAVPTSGTTGAARLVVGCRQRAENLARLLHELQWSEPVEQTVVALPLSYTYALVNQWVWSHCHGRELVMTPGFAQPDEFGRALERSRKAMICLVGMQVPLLTRYFGDRVFPGVIRVHFAGGRFPQEQLAEVRARFPNAMIFNNYGCTEAMPRLSLRRAEEAADAANIGRPLPGIELRTDSEGALQFRSPFGAVGLIDADGFHEIAPEDWVATGDLGARTPGGAWKLTGRTGEVFKRHGEKISIAALAATIHSRWAGQAAFYRETDQAGEDGCVLALAPEPEPEQLRRILSGFATEHPRAAWPLRIESLPCIPTLPNGKPDVLALAASDSDALERRIHWYQRI